MLLLGYESNTANPNRKRLNLSQVNATTRLEILKIARSKTRTHKEIGELFYVRTTVVSHLTSTLKRSKSTIVKRRVKELTKSHKQLAMVSVIQEILNKRYSIWSAKQIQNAVKEKYDIDVSLHEVLTVLKK